MKLLLAFNMCIHGNTYIVLSFDTQCVSYYGSWAKCLEAAGSTQALGCRQCGGVCSGRWHRATEPCLSVLLCLSFKPRTAFFFHPSPQPGWTPAVPVTSLLPLSFQSWEPPPARSHIHHQPVGINQEKPVQNTGFFPLVPMPSPASRRASEYNKAEEFTFLKSVR